MFRLCLAACFALLIIHLCGVPAVSWLIVLSPIIAYLGIWGVILLLLAMCGGIAFAAQKWGS